MRVLSIGGGPGFDLASVAVLADFSRLGDEVQRRREGGGNADGPGGAAARSPIAGRGGGCGVEALILDYEEGWEDCVAALEAAVCSSGGSPAKHRAQFGRCDITAPLSAPVNAKALRFSADGGGAQGAGEAAAAAAAAAPAAAAAAPLLVVASYVVAENAVALRSGGFAFVEGLLGGSPAGSAFLFAETTHRLWPDVLAAAYRGLDRRPIGTRQQQPSPCRLEVAFPTIPGRRGVALFMRKAAASSDDSGASKRQPGSGTHAAAPMAHHDDDEGSAMMNATPQGGGGGGDGRGQGATDEPSVVCVEGLIRRMREDFPGRQGLDADAELLRRFALDDREHRMRLNKQRQGSDGTPGGDEGKRREEEVAARRLDRKRQYAARRSISGGIARSSRSRGVYSG